MSKKDKKKNGKKLKKGGRTFLFVDSENVGHQIPSSLPDSCEVFYFLSDVNVYRKVYELLDLPNFHVVDVMKTATSRRREKNEMDFAIVAYLSNLLSGGVKKKDSYVILSRDKGYDKAMEVLLAENKKLSLVREEKNLKERLEPGSVSSSSSSSEFALPLPHNPSLRKRALSCPDYASFRSGLTLAQKQSIREHVMRNPDGGTCVWFEADFYTGEYVLYSSGTPDSRHPSIAAGQKRQNELLGKKNHKKKGGGPYRKKRKAAPNLLA